MSAPDRPTRDELNADLRRVAEYVPADEYGGIALRLAAEVRALRAELDTQNNELTVRRLQDLVAARTPQPAAPVIYRCDQTRHPAGPCSRCALVTSAPLPAVPDGEEAQHHPLTATALREAEQRWQNLPLDEKDRWAAEHDDPRCAFIAAALSTAATRPTGEGR